MKLCIVTGASRGLGAALVEHLLAQGHRVLGLSRQPSAVLQAHPQGVAWAVDLSAPVSVAQQLQAWLAEQDGAVFDEVVLINNAALLTEPGPTDDVPLAALSASLRVGLEAVVVLSAAFLAATRSWTARKKILQISSGLGRRAMAGAAPYCAIKAGMDHFSRALALDEAQRPQGARVVSLAPGVIDTDMQVQLRGGDPRRFSEQARFADLHRQGQLDSPAACAAKVLAYLDRPDFGADPVADVRQP